MVTLAFHFSKNEEESWIYENKILTYWLAKWFSTSYCNFKFQKKTASKNVLTPLLVLCRTPGLRTFGLQSHSTPDRTFSTKGIRGTFQTIVNPRGENIKCLKALGILFNQSTYSFIIWKSNANVLSLIAASYKVQKYVQTMRTPIGLTDSKTFSVQPG